MPEMTHWCGSVCRVCELRRVLEKWNPEMQSYMIRLIQRKTNVIDTGLRQGGSLWKMPGTEAGHGAFAGERFNVGFHVQVL
jgi:hypothetical protein